mmetsp:Transcript_10966/g.30711  ORF Transcript_10966/g.30711 Transcript_10966/m.30711 type:complete len:321 (+) Transcript_10966:101-1063(+)
MSAMSSLSLAGNVARIRSNYSTSSSTSKSRSGRAAPVRAAASDGNGAGDRLAAGTKQSVKHDKRGEAIRRDAISYPELRTAEESATDRAKRLIAEEAQAINSAIVKLPSGEKVTPWWRKGPMLRNIVDVHSADEFVAYLHEAANLDRKTGRARLVCVEYFAGWCHACRSVHPKLGKMAEKEFPDVLFLRVHKDELPEMCESLGVNKLPFVQLYKGVDGLVAEFPVSVTAPALARFRGELNQHRDGHVSLTESHDGVSRLGVATTLNARGWPSHYTSAHKKLRFRALKYYRGKGGVKGDGLPPPGCPEEPPDGESVEVMSR